MPPVDPVISARRLMSCKSIEISLKTFCWRCRPLNCLSRMCPLPSPPPLRKGGSMRVASSALALASGGTNLEQPPPIPSLAKRGGLGRGHNKPLLLSRIHREIHRLLGDELEQRGRA